MAAAYFSNFPTVSYQNSTVRNVILKTAFFNEVLQNYTAFYPYEIKEEDRADLVAFHYYGDWQYEWLVYFSNNMIDPYFDWPLNQEQFDLYMVRKYGSFETATTTIDHYTYNPNVDASDIESMYRLNYNMTPTTWQFLSDAEKGFWTPVYVYDMEFQKNEDKRMIRLLDNRLLNQVDREIEQIFRENG